MRFIKHFFNGKYLNAVQSVERENVRLSSFCIEEPTSDGVLLTHTATGELLFLKKEEYNELSSGNVLTSDLAKILANHRFLVEAELDEYAMVDKDRHAALEAPNEISAITSYTILPTSRCNARCFYCYEKGIPQRNMSPQIAQDTADFIARNCGGQKVHISWFGGEPMVAYPIISLICSRLKCIGVIFSSSMISNGLLLTEERVQSAKQCWNLENVQITVDGTESVYNETKHYKGHPANPFETVLTNIGSLLKNNVSVSIRINLGHHNYNDVSNLIDYLDQYFADKNLLSVYVHEIDNVYDPCVHDDLIEKAFDLNQRLIRLNLHRPKKLPSLRLHSCMADSGDALLINPDGQLGKCEHYAFEKLIGSIYSAEKDVSLISKWKEKATFELCDRCPLYACCYQLRWCNGSLPCSESAVRSKIASVRSSMRMEYMQWKKKCQKIRTELVFSLNGKMDVRLDAGAIYADFYGNENKQIRETRLVNSTACAILLFLREEHSFREIATMLKENYAGDADIIAQNLEDHILDMLREDLIVSRIKKNT